MKLTQARLKELLRYDPETGIFTRLVYRNSNAVIGSEAGGINSKTGYMTICIDNKGYYASRLAWLYMEGYFPEHEMEHKNRIRHDNRWKNLRQASRQCNMRNCNVLKRNTSGITGVTWHIKNEKWQAQITIFGKNVYLGQFQSRVLAAIARWNAEKKHKFPNCNTTSSAYSYIKDRGYHAI